MTSAATMMDAFFDNFSLQLQAYDDLAALAQRELATLGEGVVEPDTLRDVLDAKDRVIGRIDELTAKNRELREKAAADWGLAEVTLSALEQVAAGSDDDGRIGKHPVGDVRRIVKRLSERMVALDELERKVEDALLAVRSGVKEEMQRVHTGRGVLGAYRKAASRPGESHFMDRKR